MKPARGVLIASLLFAMQVSDAQESSTALEARAAEQERQIRQLELQNLRLREQIERLNQRLQALGASGATVDAAALEPVPEPIPKAPDSAPASTPRSHTVQPGESLSKIARLHGVTTAELIRLNQLENPGLLRQGQKIRLPATAAASASDSDSAAASAAAAPAARHHTVQSGDTLYGIARQYGLDMAELQRVNPEVDPRTLRVGQKLKLPAKAARPTERTESRRLEPARPVARRATKIERVPVSASITVADFARLHRIDLARLNALNGLDLDGRTRLAKGTRLLVGTQP